MIKYKIVSKGSPQYKAIFDIKKAFCIVQKAFLVYILVDI
jgi:hypothetical protein